MEMSHHCTLCWAGGWNGRAVSSTEGVFSVAKELRDFRHFLVANTVVEELRGLNLLGIQFALCEASKWLFYLRPLVCLRDRKIWPAPFLEPVLFHPPGRVRATEDAVSRAYVDRCCLYGGVANPATT